MKKHLILLLSIAVYIPVKAQTVDPSLKGLEQKINTASDNLYTQGKAELTGIIDSLAKWKQTSTEKYTDYWYAYALYRLGIYYLSNDKIASLQAIEKGIEILEKITAKNSEEYVLLGSLISFSNNFYPDNAPKLSAIAKGYYDKAIELDKNNMRAYLSVSRSDFYKPVQFGGGRVVEKNALKAISLKEKSSDHPLAPSWGREDAYKLLVNFYEREGKKEDARIFCNKGLQEFPKSLQLNMLKKSLQQ